MTNDLPRAGKLVLDNYAYHLKPPDLTVTDPERVTRYRRELAEHLLHGDGDLNLIVDEARIKSREKYSRACSIFCYILVLLVFCAAGAGLGVSVYSYITGAWFSGTKMKLFGIIASSIVLAYSVLTFIFMVIDKRRKKLRSPMKDYKFLLEVQVSQNIQGDQNVLIYSSELLANQLIPRTNTYSISTVPHAVPVTPMVQPIRLYSKGFKPSFVLVE